jgi:hypothetical protein
MSAPPGAAAGPTGPRPSPTNPPATAPAPGRPSPEMQQGTQMVIGVVHNLRSIATAFPSTTPEINEINNLMRSVLAKMMQHQRPGEPEAPPAG